MIDRKHYTAVGNDVIKTEYLKARAMVMVGGCLKTNVFNFSMEIKTVTNEIRVYCYIIEGITASDIYNTWFHRKMMKLLSYEWSAKKNLNGVAVAFATGSFMPNIERNNNYQRHFETGVRLLPKNTFEIARAKDDDILTSYYGAKL